MKLKTLAEVMAELPEDERRKIEARAQELIAEEEARGLIGMKRHIYTM